MSDAEEKSDRPAAGKKSPGKTKKPKSHPKVAEMVEEAILNLKDRDGSSLQAIKKYIAVNFKVDIERLTPFIRKHLKSAVKNEILVQTKGKGASGSFKIKSNDKKEESEFEKKAVPKATKSQKKVATPKKAVKKVTPKKPKAVKKPKSPKPKKAKSTPKKAGAKKTKGKK